MEIGANTIIRGDCLKVLPHIEPNSIDFICADLPFGKTAASWDKHISMDKLWPLYEKVLSKDGVIALFADQPFASLLVNSNLDNYRYSWYWVKNQSTNFYHAKRMPLRKVEEITIFYKGKYFPQITSGHPPTNSSKGISKGRVYHGKNERDEEGGKTTRYPTNVLDFKCVNNYKRRHPNEKPLDLIRYLIRTYTNEGELILDNTSGSGVLAEACILEKRDFLLIEKEEEYYNDSIDRVKGLASIKTINLK